VETIRRKKQVTMGLDVLIDRNIQKLRLNFMKAFASPGIKLRRSCFCRRGRFGICLPLWQPSVDFSYLPGADQDLSKGGEGLALTGLRTNLSKQLRAWAMEWLQVRETVEVDKVDVEGALEKTKHSCQNQDLTLGKLKSCLPFELACLFG
jgi:hypothetical protein